MGPIPEINSLAATAQGELVSGGGDGVCRVWDLAAGQQTASLHGHVDLIHSVASRSSHQQVRAVAQCE
jgi:WD40 repeat protein